MYNLLPGRAQSTPQHLYKRMPVRILKIVTAREKKKFFA